MVETPFSELGGIIVEIYGIVAEPCGMIHKARWINLKMRGFLRKARGIPI